MKKIKLSTILTLILAAAGVVMMFVAIHTRELDNLAIALGLLLCAIVPSVAAGLEYAYTWNRLLFAALAVIGLVCIFLGWRIGMLAISGVGIVLIVAGAFIGKFFKDPVRVDAWKHYFE